MMKYALYLCLGILGLKGCTKSPYIEFHDAQIKDWVAGTELGGRGTDYFVNAKFTKDGNYDFVNLFYNDKAFQVIAIDTLEDGSIRQVDSGDFKKGRNITFMAAESSHQATVQAKMPISTEAKGVLAYSVAGKLHYLEIPNFKKFDLNSMP